MILKHSYKIDEMYLNTMHNKDNKVSLKNNCYVPLFLVGNVFYCAPLEKPHKEGENGEIKEFKDSMFVEPIRNGKLGNLALNKMLPVPSKFLEPIKIESGDSIINRQISALRKKPNKVYMRAVDLYLTATQNRNQLNDTAKKFCVNWNGLEKECVNYTQRIYFSDKNKLRDFNSFFVGNDNYIYRPVELRESSNNNEIEMVFRKGSTEELYYTVVNKNANRFKPLLLEIDAKYTTEKNIFEAMDIMKSVREKNIQMVANAKKQTASPKPIGESLDDGLDLIQE